MVKKEAAEAFLASLDPKCKYCPPQIVAKLLQSRAIGCFTALLERKIPHNRLDLRKPVQNSLQPLHYAAKLGFHEAIELLIRHGVSARVDILIRGAIDYALEASCHEWNKKTKIRPDVLSDLILWLPEWISDAGNFNRWHTVKLLGRSNDEGLEKEIYEYARNGQAVKLLWLLLAVPDRVLSPTFLDCLCGDNCWIVDSWLASSRLKYYSLRDFLTAQLAFVIADIWCCHDDDPQLIKSLEEKRSILTTSLLLLEVFQRAGTQLSNLIPMLEKHHLSNSPIAQQVKTVLEGAGIPLTSLNCPIISTQDSKINYPYPSGPLIRGETVYHNMNGSRWYWAFLIQPACVCRSKILDSEFSRAIEKLCYHPYLKEWSSEMSAFKLLFIFCLPDLVEKMQCMLQLELKYDNPAKVIHPTYLAELCFIYITEGRIVEFTAALMTVRVLLQLDHPLSPQMSYHTHHGYVDYTPTFYDFLLHALRRVLDEEISLTGKSQDNVTVQIFKEKKSVISFTFLLSQIFEKSSQHIHRYLHSPRYKVIQECRDLKMIVDDVASLLEDSGFVLTSQDICVNHLECFSSEAGVSRTGLEGNSLSFVPHLQTTSCVKEKQAARVSKAIMSPKNIESSLLVGSSISKFSSRSYHSFPMLRYEEGSKVTWLPGQNGVNLVTKKSVVVKWSGSILRKSWKFLTMTKML